MDGAPVLAPKGPGTETDPKRAFQTGVYTAGVDALSPVEGMRFHLGIQLTRTSGLLTIAALLLLVAIATPWYVVNSSAGGSQSLAYYLPTSTTAGGTVLVGTAQNSYADYHLNNTGDLATAVFYVLLVGLVCAAVGAVFALFTALPSFVRRLSSLLGLIALIAAIAAPLLWFAALPGAIGKDLPSHTGSGPWSSFFGSTTIAGVSQNWAPSFGWYFSLGSFVVLLIGLIWMLRKRPSGP